MSVTSRANSPAPLVSVLMTVYNGQRFLTEAIDSILAQTFSDFEFIIVDDGSMDGTARIIREYASRETRIQFLQLERNRGQAVALNHGLELARGKYITRMDCDDISLPQRLQKQVDFLNAHPEIGVLGAAQQMADETLQPLALEAFPSAHAQIVINHLAGLASIGGAVVMIRAQELYAIGAFDPQRHTARDWELFAKLSARARLANLPDVLYRYRRHGQNMTITRKTELIADWKAYRQRWFNRLLGEEAHASTAFARFLAMYQDRRLNLRERALLRRDARRLVNALIVCPSFVAEDHAQLEAALAARLPSLAPRLWTRLGYWRRKRLGF